MIARLVVYALATSVPLALAGALLEHAMALSGRPRRWIWTMAIGTALLLPALMPWRAAPGLGSSSMSLTTDLPSLPDVDSGGRLWSQLKFVAAAAAIRIDAASAALGRADALCRWTWTLGSGGLVLVYALGSWNLRRRQRGWRETTVGGTDVLLAPLDGPAVVGVLSPRLVIPEWAVGLAAESIVLMLRHEEEHRRSRDPLLVHAASLALILMPWNPVAWWMVSRLKLAVEVDCDARVLAGAPGDADAGRSALYGQLLLTVAARRSRSLGIVPAMLARSSALSRRLSAMFPDPRRHPRARIATGRSAALVLLTIALLTPVPSVQGQAKTSKDQSSSKDHQAPSKANEEFGKGAYKQDAPRLVLPKVKRRVDPKYTREAMQAKIQGDVDAEVVVKADGTVGAKRIVKSLDSTHGLDRSALDAASQWTFEPGTVNGRVVPVIVSIHFTFSLR